LLGGLLLEGELDGELLHPAKASAIVNMTATIAELRFFPCFPVSVFIKNPPYNMLYILGFTYKDNKKGFSSHYFTKNLQDEEE
jgi:hypothetical protein